MILTGRTYFGKEVYDLMRAVDVLYSFDFIDKEKIGAIGHSAAGNVLVYFMFVDKRIKVGVSSCTTPFSFNKGFMGTRQGN